MTSDPYALEIALAWRAYVCKFPFVPFYQFATAYKAGWDASTSHSETLEGSR